MVFQANKERVEARLVIESLYGSQMCQAFVSGQLVFLFTM